MNKKGILIVVSGFSGAGKGTLMKELMRKYPENYALSISATTRGPRDGEVDGREYFFLSREKFEKMIANNELIEYAKYVENYYGTPRAYVEKMLDEGKDVILEIDSGSTESERKVPGYASDVCDTAECQRTEVPSGRKRDRNDGGY